MTGLPDLAALAASLDEHGYALTPPLLDPEQCLLLASMFDGDSGFRSTVTMARHGFGRGVYRYFSYPLPTLVSDLRRQLYAALVPIANLWSERLGHSEIWPDTLEAFTDQCHAFGQDKPTPLLLSYGPGDFNCLHHDLYGPIYFPLQAVVMLSPADDFEGGTLAIVENRPRMQSRIETIPVCLGQVAVIPVRERPRRVAGGWSRTSVRHGVSTVTHGQRRTLGLIFHDAA